MDNNHVQLTKEAYESLKSELKGLNEVKRPALVERLSRAMAEGDLSENADYQSAKEELEFLDGRIAELSAVVENAKIVSGKKPTNGSVGLGTKVTVTISGKKLVFTIVGEWEADPIKQRISHSSPLGTALSGKRVGDTVEVDAPAGKVAYKILEIE